MKKLLGIYAGFFIACLFFASINSEIKNPGFVAAICAIVPTLITFSVTDDETK